MGNQPLVVILDGMWELEYKILGSLYVVRVGTELQRNSPPPSPGGKFKF